MSTKAIVPLPRQARHRGVARHDRGVSLARVPEVGAAWGDRVVGDGDRDDPLRGEPAQQVVEDRSHVRRVAVERDTLDDVVHPDEQGREVGFEPVERRQLVADEVGARVAVHAQVRDEVQLDGRRRRSERGDELVRVPIGHAAQSRADGVGVAERDIAQRGRRVLDHRPDQADGNRRAVARCITCRTYPKRPTTGRVPRTSGGASDGRACRGCDAPIRCRARCTLDTSPRSPIPRGRQGPCPPCAGVIAIRRRCA